MVIIELTKKQKLLLISLAFILSLAVIIVFPDKKADTGSVELFSVKKLTAEGTYDDPSELSAMQVIVKFMNDPFNNKDLSNAFALECISSLRLIKIETVYAPKAADKGEYSDTACYTVTYDIQYKPEYKNFVTEPSGVVTKYMNLVKTQHGWIIDSVG